MGAADMDHLVNAQQFKGGMRRLAGAVCILTLNHGGRRAGLTATAVCSISAEPPRLMVCINRNVYAHELVMVGAALCVNVLGSDQIGDAKRFAGMVEGVSGDERFAAGPWMESPGRALELGSALVRFQCRIAEIHPASTHSIVLCDVVAVTTAEVLAAPLVYFDGRFLSVAELAKTQ